MQDLSHILATFDGKLTYGKFNRLRSVDVPQNSNLISGKSYQMSPFCNQFYSHSHYMPCILEGGNT